MAELTCDAICTEAAASVDLLNAIQTGIATLTRYNNAFFIPFLTAFSIFNRVESQRFWTREPLNNLSAYLRLGKMNLDLMGRYLSSSSQATDHFFQNEVKDSLTAIMAGDQNELIEFSRRMDGLVKGVAYAYPEAIENIESDFGFHFERQPSETLVFETDRFTFHQVLPVDSKVKVRQDGKPVLIIPPYVLGANILSFLPKQDRSYAHAFANQAIPTYVRVVKDIQESEAVQKMSIEDDARDTRDFCELLKKKHGRPVTLNGYCQGGFVALCDIASGLLDGLVDVFISCVAPMDGTRSKGISSFLGEMPEEFIDLSYGTRLMRNGVAVVDGNLMGWIYKLKSIEAEAPLLTMWRDMMLVDHSNGVSSQISKTAAALNYWLLNERSDLPVDITQMSFDSYHTPITDDGTLPIKMFGKKLSLKRLEQNKIKWLICYGLQDDLVEPDSALAPVDFIDVEVTAFPKGHVAIATSWSHPKSDYAIHEHYKGENSRGPVRFHLDMQDMLDQGSKSSPPKKKTNQNNP